MVAENEVRSVLVAAGPESQPILNRLFASEELAPWEATSVESLTRTRFNLQHEPFDLVVVHEDLVERDGASALAWLAWQNKAPILLLAGNSAELFTSAYRMGVTLCLPAALALQHPPLLASAFEQAISLAESKRGCRQAQDQLHQNRRHIDRLVSLIWRMTPGQTELQWYSQRHMLDRLQEELARAERHKTPLTVAIGEMRPQDANGDVESTLLPEWTPALIAKTKRRCDVAGQYGLQSFLLLMVQTPAEGGAQCCQRLQKFLEHAPSETGSPHPRFQTYFGLSSTLDGKTSSLALLSAAEQNLEEARAAAAT